jgi:hypothetical protein
MINIKDLQWTAGFLEGEGSFTATENWNKTQNKMSRNIAVTASQVNKEPLEKLQSLFGGRIYFYRGGGRKLKNGDTWQGIWIWWKGGGPGGIGLAMTLFSLMSTKRKEQIKKMIALWKSFPGRGFYRQNHCCNGHEMVGDNVKIVNGHRVCIPCRQLRDRIQYLMYREKYIQRATKSKRRAIEVLQ